MGFSLHEAAGWLPGVTALRRLGRIERLARRIAHFGKGSSATYVGDNRVLVRVIAGRHVLAFYVHGDDKLLSPWLIINGEHEGDLTDYFVRELKHDSHCIDVGANFGYFSCLMAKYCPDGRVLGLEPNPAVHALAIDNLLVNGLQDHAAVLHAAASDRAGEITLYRRIGRAGNTSIAAAGEPFTRDMREPREEAFQVGAHPIDSLRDRLDGRIDFMKIDVEGAEPLALAGARATIAANPQLRIVMEWSPVQVRHAGFDVAAFVDDIAAAGLQPFLMTERRLRPISHADLAALPYQTGVLLRRPPA